MATRWQFSMRWLLLLTFLVAGWAALMFRYDRILGSPARNKAFILACSTLSAAVVLTAVSVAPSIAKFHRLLWRNLSIEDYQWVSRRFKWSLVQLAVCMLPLLAVAYFDAELADWILEMPREVALTIAVPLFATPLVLLGWCVGLIAMIVKSARCRCPACGQRLNRVSIKRDSSGCVHCRAVIAGRSDAAVA